MMRSMASEDAARHLRRAAEAAARDPVSCAIITISDTRTPEDDVSGDRIRAMLPEVPATLAWRTIVRDDVAPIDAALSRALHDREVQVVITTGGTGFSSRDTTVDVVRRRLTREIPGFGELFRMASWEEVGAASMLSGALGGLVVQDESDGGDTFIFALPGSKNAVETAMAKLLIPQLAHLVWERGR